ncbi:hypothetical protein EVAR_49730_1 [Eumeta japonica]|uniref:Uncharacterized protein n=1 Tax=Eumeta variegata TaxID=151549 RepID=A0A4C1ZP02_EUMVA|nr:hypothetical protein EVAR_49730_1 [Eumeta japonica]
MLLTRRLSQLNRTRYARTASAALKPQKIFEQRPKDASKRHGPRLGLSLGVAEEFSTAARAFCVYAYDCSVREGSAAFF